MNKIKVALMTSTMDRRTAKGTAVYTRKVVEGLLQYPEFDLTLIHYERVPEDKLYEKAREIVIPRVSFPVGSRMLSEMVFFLKMKFSGERFDVLQWFSPRLYPLYFFAPAKRIVVVCHGAADKINPGMMTFSRRFFNFIFTYFHFWVDAAIGSSNSGREEVIRHYRFSPEKVPVIYLGVDESFRPVGSDVAKIVLGKYGIRGPFILDVSRLQPHKNVGRLIEAYLILRQKRSGIKEKLVIVGTAYDRAGDTIKLAASSDRSKDIVFIDFVSDDDLPAFYSGARLFVFPSLNEGFGLPVAEAMACGVPVITSNISSLPEVGARAALLIDPYKPEEIADAMYRVLADDSLRNTMINRGFAVVKKFTWSKTAEETAALYKKLLFNGS